MSFKVGRWAGGRGMPGVWFFFIFNILSIDMFSLIFDVIFGFCLFS